MKYPRQEADIKQNTIMCYCNSFFFSRFNTVLSLSFEQFFVCKKSMFFLFPTLQSRSADITQCKVIYQESIYLLSLKSRVRPALVFMLACWVNYRWKGSQHDFKVYRCVTDLLNEPLPLSDCAQDTQLTLSEDESVMGLSPDDEDRLECC